jgi:ubiquinone/menaquinone biosynthesis C-methylase UbiE
MSDALYDPAKVRGYYNQFGRREWQRLDASAHARLIYHLHVHFLQGKIGWRTAVLDAGCGAGRFAVHIARTGGTVTLVDISEEQISLAREKLTELDLLERTAGFHRADIRDLSCLEDHSFDTTLCYGGALNYLFQEASPGLAELVRVTKPGGAVLVSVMSRWGTLRYTVGNENLDPADFFGRPEYWKIPQVAETGDLPAHLEVNHPPRHFFDSEELRALLQNAGLQDVQLGAAPSISAALNDRLELIEPHPAAWNTLLQLEEQAYCLPGMLDAGEHLLARGKVPL